MIQTDTLSSQELSFIKSSLESNRGISGLEMDRFEKNHPYVVNKVNNEYHIIDCNKEYYGLHDINFNNFLIEKFSQGDWTLDTFYKLTYYTGDYSLPHKDVKSTACTIVVLLSDNFTGGETIIDGKDINLNRTGMYVAFNGSEIQHGVNKVTSGSREALVIWFNRKEDLI